MKRYEFVGKLIDYDHLNCSIYGNPRYQGTFEGENGIWLTGKTASNAACAYSFLNSPDKERKVFYHITRDGNVIFDRIEIM